MSIARIPIALGAVLALTVACNSQSVSPRDAAKHVGKSVTVCGTVSSARYWSESRGRSTARRPTFLNFGGAFPNHDFTGVIFEEDRAKFGEPEKACLNRSVCIKGTVQLYRDKPEIVLTERSQLSGC